jgi:STAS-like domain of unknown function (DUF4325)
MVIRIANIVPEPSTYEDGEKVYALVLPALQRGEDVVLSFSGIGSVPSSFINAAVIRLIENVPFAVIKKHLKFIDTTKNINELIKSRFAFVTKSGASR